MTDAVFGPRVRVYEIGLSEVDPPDHGRHQSGSVSDLMALKAPTAQSLLEESRPSPRN